MISTSDTPATSSPARPAATHVYSRAPQSAQTGRNENARMQMWHICNHGAPNESRWHSVHQRRASLHYDKGLARFHFSLRALHQRL